jgi:hypothetical protein
MIWESKSNGTSQAAWFWKLPKYTYRAPFGATSGIEFWSSSQTVPVPVVWNVQLGCEPEMIAGADQLRPPSSE